MQGVTFFSGYSRWILLTETAKSTKMLQIQETPVVEFDSGACVRLQALNL